MGKCSIIVNKNLLASLLLNYHDDGQAVVLMASKWSNEDDIYYCEIESKKLPNGYWGVQDIIIDLFDVKFKLDIDV
jgi:hypothetical protein